MRSKIFIAASLAVVVSVAFEAGFSAGQEKKVNTRVYELRTYTTLPGRGFAGRPGTTVVRMAGASPLELFASICWERPMGVFLPVDARLAASDFEKAYALWAAWRHAQDPAREVRERTAA